MTADGDYQVENIGQAASHGLLVLTCIAFVLRYCSLNAQIQLLNQQVIRTRQEFIYFLVAEQHIHFWKHDNRWGLTSLKVLARQLANDYLY